MKQRCIALQFLHQIVLCGLMLAVCGWNYKTRTHQPVIPCNTEVTSTTTNALKFVWKLSENEVPYVVSENNVCWDMSQNDIFIRKCNLSTGRWYPRDVNCTLPQRKNVICPEDLDEIYVGNHNHYICVKVSKEPRKFTPEICYGSDALAIQKNEHLTKVEVDSLIRFLGEKGISKYWLPVRRSTETQYPLFMIQLPGKYWRQIYEIDMPRESLLSGQSCLAVTVTGAESLSVNVADCSQHLHSVCIFRERFVSLSGCPQGFAAMSYRPNDCYGIEWEYGLFPLDLRPLLPAEYFAKRNILQKILKSTEAKRNQYFMIEAIVDKAEPDTYAVEMNIEEKFRIVKMDSKKPALSNEVLDNGRRKNVEMTLKWDAEEQTVMLTVYNRNYIWRIGNDEDDYGIKCFTNAGHELWESVDFKMVWENDFETKSLFKLELFEFVHGYYWCSAHTIFNFAEVKTPKVVAVRRQKGHLFAASLDVPCQGGECFYPHRSIKGLNKRIKKLLSAAKKDNKKSFENIDIQNVRIMEFNMTESTAHAVRTLCHIAVSLKQSAVDNSFEESSEESDSEEVQLSIRHDTSVRMQLGMLLAQLISQLQADHEKTVRSTEFCFPETFRMTNGADNQWNLARCGQSATSAILCLQGNGLPITRRCEGDFLRGARWEKLMRDEISCLFDSSNQTITHHLYELDITKVSKNAPQKAVKYVKHLLENNIKYVIPADLYYMARIIQSSVKAIMSTNPNVMDTSKPFSTLSNDTEYLMRDIVSIYNYLMKISESVLRPSVVLNSTNMLLDAFENLVDKMSLIQALNVTQHPNEFSSNANGKRRRREDLEEEDRYIETIEYEDVGVEVKIATNFLVFFINPVVANITGIALFTRGDGSDEQLEDVVPLRGAFNKEYFMFISANQAPEELLNEKSLQIAAFVPESLWNRLDEISQSSNNSTRDRPEARIVIKVYSTDKLFQETETPTVQEVEGKIISVSIPGHDKELPEILPILFRSHYEENEKHETITACSYWNYETWANDGLTFLARSIIDDDLVLCGCTHLTPFAYLVGGGFISHNDSYSLDEGVVVVEKAHEEALDIITFLGCCLSLFGIIGIFATAAIFQSWRQKATSKILLQLSAAIALQMVLFCFINTEKYTHHLIENKIFSSCIAIGALLHYSVLVQFFWMLVIAYLQFKRYVQIFGQVRPKHFFIKSCLFGWGSPSLLVLMVLLLDSKSYIPTNVGMTICYPSGQSLYVGIILPIVVIIVANLIIFVTVATSIFRGSARAIRHTEKRLALSQMRLSILLFFLLGFTWIFGLLTTFRMGLIFSYLFSLTATLQGFVLFIYFVILDPVTRRMWFNCFQKTFGIKPGTYESSTSMRETTQTS